MLHLNKMPMDPFNSNLDSAVQFSEWKVLIYDIVGQDIISPIWSVKELREQGVTLHMSLTSSRESIPEAPAVYLVSPTNEVVNVLCKDIESRLYRYYYINFLSHSPRLLLERLAQCAVEHNATVQIKKVCDQYCNFISLEDNFFVLTHRNESLSFYALNRTNTDCTQVDKLVNSMADGLFSMLITLGSVPIIRCSRGGYAEVLARTLDEKLRNALNDTKNNYFTGIGQRSVSSAEKDKCWVVTNAGVHVNPNLTWHRASPVLLKTNPRLEKNRACLTDVRLNRVRIPGDTTGSTAIQYDLEDSDEFWVDHKDSVFPCVAERIQQELENYRTSEDEIKRLKAAFGMGDSDDDKVVTMLSSSTARLTSAVSSLPKLLERKKTLDMHTNIATALLAIIKERKLDTFFGLNEKITSGTFSDKALEDFFQNETGAQSDRLRLLLVYYIMSKRNPDIERFLSSCGPNASNALKFVRRWKSLTAALMDVRDSTSTATVTNMFSDLLSKASHFAMEGVKNFVLNKKKVPVTRIVEHVMENKNNSETDNFACFDPKRSSHQGGMPDPLQMRTTFSEAIVFIVGGGNYVEYTNLEQYRKEKSPGECSITYGATQLINAESFLVQLEQLGSEIS